MTEWIKISEKHPGIGVTCLVLDNNSFYPPCVAAFITGRGFVDIMSGESISLTHLPTHWIPLPSRPEN